MPSKTKDIVERHPPEERVAVESNFNGYCREFGITVVKGDQYELSAEVIEKYNRDFKTKSGDKPFKVLSKIDSKKKGKVQNDGGDMTELEKTLKPGESNAPNRTSAK